MNGDLASNMKTSVPILTLSAEACPPVPEGYPYNGLTDEQRQLVDRLAKHAPTLFDTNGTPEQQAKEAKWTNAVCLIRYLKATKWDYDLAVTRLSATLAWRREYKPDEITADEVAPEAQTGKEYLCGFDKLGRPIIYLVPSRENTKTYDRQLRFVAYNIEKAILAMPYGVQSICMVVDYENISMSTAPPLSVTRRFLQILGDHYPEHLGTSFIINPSWYLSVLFRIITPFMDPVTRSKLHMCNLKALIAQERSGKDASNTAAAGKPTEGTGGWTDIRHYISKDNLVSEYGGEYNFEWNFETYWSALSSLKPGNVDTH
ncbi:hypothetical protein BATDEDRAFT_35437 [Batrachochytrium dendrobatidis JAM81]|uniref:CRAL-TRIO domain-containing protein n=2 Tax=Batrachochytrium dendrobatidis TaxID=109871 RepID=F4P638_BATDJ|nr:uncharacterized protein BATDEDRAFT_35437 [Batrachochytrium dendrobatidis JAM81]EGF79285.1 hypothetical protein BATDEDRAFT_35437 [Batrachochytrium dendrobatidis JAM81]OAJ42687.1 hypothetical protein BDEG_26109 [Batrachochytrium dendrobatidis JEL423]|eukprot:XP_006680000.1 hypothetical protein BATDEDRAFT_35437 [Batrachochytrium dendrobatidis JAM81]